MNIGPTCPSCGRRVPFRQTQWRRGQAFACAGCNASLIVPKAYWALGMFALYWVLRDRIDVPGGKLALLAVMLLLAFGIEVLLTKPRLAPPS